MAIRRMRRESAGPAALAGHEAGGLRVRIAWRPQRSWQAVPLRERVGRFAAAAEGFTHGELSVVVIGQRAMAALHARALAVEGPTDVLTFDLGTDRRRRRLEGEIYICADVARATSQRILRRGHVSAASVRAQPLAAARAELALYLVHGVLHLAGYGDLSDADYARIHAREDALLRQLGLGTVFRDGERSA